MKNPIRLFVSFSLAAGLSVALPAQEPAPFATDDLANQYVSSPAELDALLGPIALYPDDLIALILPAATESTDIVLAGRYFANRGTVQDVDRQPWDESVRALAHFPEVITRLSDDLGWTRDVGEAFLAQPAEVMKSIQRLRAIAYAAGTLRDTPQQKLLIDGDVIRIVSAVDNVIYVPSYRTEVVYVDRPHYAYSQPFITFGIGWHVGSWHRWDCDWNNRRIWVFNSHNDWYAHRRHVHVSHVHWGWNNGRSWHSPRVHVRTPQRPQEPRNRDWTRPGSFVGSDRDHPREREHASLTPRDSRTSDRMKQVIRDSASEPRDQNATRTPSAETPRANRPTQPGEFRRGDHSDNERHTNTRRFPETVNREQPTRRVVTTPTPAPAYRAPTPNVTTTPRSSQVPRTTASHTSPATPRPTRTVTTIATTPSVRPSANTQPSRSSSGDSSSRSHGSGRSAKNDRSRDSN